jgi:tRNA-splicing ligase RtcB
MFVKPAEGPKKPVKIWLSSVEQAGSGCLAKAANLSGLPFLYKWPALMPNCHGGNGMPVGAVIATEGVVIPNAVGEDIGCGVSFVQTDIHANLLKIEVGQTSLIQSIVDCIMRNVPVGLAQHQEKQACRTISRANEYLSAEHRVKELEQELRAGYYYIGTLGGGGHFIEIQEDESGYVGIMVHSGSRKLGPQICNYFNEIAKTLNERWYSSVPKEYGLAFLPEKTSAGQSYIHWMNLAVDFAAENREKIMSRVKEILFTHVRKYGEFIGAEKGKEITCHHNYAALENHYGQDVWVHRRGAIRAREGDVGIVPGAMGCSSYIVTGRGNPDSFNSCSNGAGRDSSGSRAPEKYSVQSIIKELKQGDVTLGKLNYDDLAAECCWAYNDIDAVMAQEQDLVRPVKKLKPIGVIKG